MIKPISSRMATVAGFACAFAIVLTLSAQQVDYSGELPRISPTAPESAIETFTIADGFTMQMVAAEPLIGSPVAIEWDASGAMYVCEMRGYSEQRDEAISSIAKLTDTDQDGIYDTRTNFADGLLWPTGIFPYDDGLFVGDAPDLWYLKDTDNDGKADIKQRVLTGFGTTNVQGLLNSFRWGLDNRMHIACSSAGGSIRHAHANPNESTVNISGRDLALDPRTLLFEPTSGAAQHGMCFDDWGRKFVSSNSDHVQQVMYEDRYFALNPFAIPPPSRTSIASDGPQAEVYRSSPVEPWRIVRTRLRDAGQAPGPIEGGGRAAGYFTGATGLTLYRGDGWPETWRGLAVVGDVGGNLVHRKKLHSNGLQFTASRIDVGSELVTSTDTWFRPAQFANAPNGMLHVIDFYREVIEHPASLPPEIKQHLDLTSGRDRGRIYQIVPTGARPRQFTSLQQRTTAELVKTLAHPNSWHRETCARLLYERQDSAAIEPLISLLQDSEDSLATVHALYALEGLGGLNAKVLTTLLKHDHPQVRRQAVRLSEAFAESDLILDQLEYLIDDPSLEVRYQLAFSLGLFKHKDRVKQLARLTRNTVEDRWVTSAILCSSGIDDKALHAMLSNDVSFQSDHANLFLKQLSEQIAARRRSRSSGASNTEIRTVRYSMPARWAEEETKRKRTIDKYQPSLTIPSEVSRGAEHFKKHCSACHQVSGVGHAIGPSLVAFKSRGSASILTAVLDPNREVHPQYLHYVVATNDGHVDSGVIVDEGPTSLTIRTAKNQTRTLRLIEVQEIKNTGNSLMPEGFENSLDLQAMADLIAYLMQAQ